MSPLLRAVAFCIVALASGRAQAEDVTVMISGGFLSSYKALVPGFEAASHHRVVTVPGPSMGATPDAIPQRLLRGEADDVLIMVGSALDGLIKGGKAVAASKVDLALSPIGVAVRAGKPVPDISTAAKLREALLAARSVVYSDSASGVYVKNELFKRLGIETEMASTAHVIPATPVGEIVARGEADLGLQQVAELLPVHGIAFAGRLPADVQKVTVYSAAIATGARHPEAGRALIAYLDGPAATSVLATMGLDPVEP